MKTTKPKTQRLRWDSEYDDHDNTRLTAVGGSTDGESGDLYYGLKQQVRNNRHVWVEDSSPELMMDPEGPLTWPTLPAAKAAIQAHHDEVLASYQSSRRR